MNAMLRVFLTFFLISILSLSSIGVPVFTHVCNGMEETWVSFFVSPKACCAKSPVNKTTTCCKQINEGSDIPLIKKSPCCEDSITFEYPASDFVSSFHPAQKKQITSSPSFFFLDNRGDDFTIETIQPEYYDHRVLTSRYGRSLLIFEQLFLC